VECKNNHRYDSKFNDLPHDQSGIGRHKCPGCAYEKGYQDGFLRNELINITLGDLPESQAGNIRHKSSHLAYAQGYCNGIIASYQSDLRDESG
jgi:hypothetical protein